MTILRHYLTAIIVSVLLMFSCRALLSQEPRSPDTVTDKVVEVVNKVKQTAESITEKGPQKGVLSVRNETKTPKIFTLSSEDSFKIRLTLSGNKDYFLEPGRYQVSYYSPLQAKQISRYIVITSGKSVAVVFRKTEKLGADFFIE